MKRVYATLLVSLLCAWSVVGCSDDETMDPENVACPYPTSSMGGELRLFQADRSRLLGAVLVSDEDGFVLTVDCYPKLQLEDDEDRGTKTGATLVVDGLTWVRVGEVSAEYRLLGVPCCATAEVPEGSTPETIEELLDTVSLGGPESWTDLFESAASSDEEAGLEHMTLAGDVPAAYVNTYRPGLDYRLVARSEETFEECENGVYVEAGEGPRTSCSIVQIDSPEWVGLLVSALP